MSVDKSPATILNEMMAKIRSTVAYELCSSEMNSHPPLFTYKVICDGVYALGLGHSKKEAKQNAAHAMLEKINKREFVPSPLPAGVTVTDPALQELKKLCLKYNFDDAIFEELDVRGPAHAPNFSVQCTVSTLTEVGTGTTKKQAKVDAANKILQKLQDTFSVDKTQNVDNLSKSSHRISTGEAAKLKINYSFKTSTEPIEIMENHQDLASVLAPKVKYLQDLLKELQMNVTENNANKMKQEFQSVLESVNIDFHHMLLQTSDPATHMLIIQLNTIPDILEMSLGASREEAELRTINKVIETLNVLLN